MELSFTLMHFFVSLFYLIDVIWVINFYHLVHFQCTWVGYFLIKSSYIIYQKKKKLRNFQKEKKKRKEKKKGRCTELGTMFFSQKKNFLTTKQVFSF